MRVKVVVEKVRLSLGDPEADDGFTAVYRETYPMLMRVGFLLTGSNEIAEDLVQDVFERSRDRIAGLDYPASYLRAAVVNACRSYHRRRRVAERHVRSSTEPVLPSQLVEFRDALAVLSPRQRATVVLRYFCDLSDGEIAQILGCRLATVRSLIQRGLHRLREALT